ncbi:MAG: hypothetical protein U0736_03490 [Gemmataceae bacterium]
MTVRRYGVGNVTYLSVQPSDEAPEPIYNKERLPALLFLSAGAMTLAIMAVLWALLPDVFRRTAIWARLRFRTQLEVAGMLRLPASGPVILVTDADTRDGRDEVRSAADRVVTFLDPTTTDDLEALLRRGRKHLAHGRVVGVLFDRDGTAAGLLEGLMRDRTAPVLPVHRDQATENGWRQSFVVAGSLLPPDAEVVHIRDELHRLREDLGGRIVRGEVLETEPAGH